MPEYHAVLFDFFGTLTRRVQRGRQHRAVAESLGCDPDEFVNILDRSYYLRASGTLGDAETTLRWVCQQAGVRPSTQALRAAVAARVQALRADTRLRGDALHALRALRRRGIRTGLISDCTHELPVFLPRLPIARLLDVQVLSVRLGRCKPDPVLYLTACRRLGLRPQECLYVGDGGSRELTGARAAGLSAVRLAAADLAGHLVFNPDTDWPGPELSRLSDVIDLVESPRERAPGPVRPAPARWRSTVRQDAWRDRRTGRSGVAAGGRGDEEGRCGLGDGGRPGTGRALVRAAG